MSKGSVRIKRWFRRKGVAIEGGRWRRKSLYPVGFSLRGGCWEGCFTSCVGGCVGGCGGNPGGGRRMASGDGGQYELPYVIGRG